MKPQRPDHPRATAAKAILTGGAGRWLILLAAILLLMPSLLPPFAQPQDYHAYADRRGWIGIPNFGDVVSSAAFLWIGLTGLWTLRRPSVSQMPATLRHAYATMFTGLALAAFGSAYYHWAPSDARLVWDRLPIALVFMPLLAATLVERLRLRSDAALLVLSLLGIASVVFWKISGNLTPYLVAQIGAIVLLAAALLLLPATWSGRGWMFAALAGYVVAFFCERFDAAIFAFTDCLVSGHTCKHLAAAFAFCFIIAMLRRQRRIRTAPETAADAADRQGTA